MAKALAGPNWGPQLTPRVGTEALDMSARYWQYASAATALALLIDVV